jgi:hypothetical protein
MLIKIILAVAVISIFAAAALGLMPTGQPQKVPQGSLPKFRTPGFETRYG